MTIDDFLSLDRKTDLLSFVADAYDSFHLTGDLGILEESDDYATGVRVKRRAFGQDGIRTVS
jgi:hypothetical protein